MAQFGIGHSVLSLPQYDPSPSNNATYIGMVRLINEWLAALSEVYPEHFTFYASAPLPKVLSWILLQHFSPGPTSEEPGIHTDLALATAFSFLRFPGRRGRHFGHTHSMSLPGRRSSSVQPR